MLPLSFSNSYLLLTTFQFTTWEVYTRLSSPLGSFTLLKVAKSQRLFWILFLFQRKLMKLMSANSRVLQHPRNLEVQKRGHKEKYRFYCCRQPRTMILIMALVAVFVFISIRMGRDDKSILRFNHLFIERTAQTWKSFSNKSIRHNNHWTKVPRRYTSLVVGYF